MLKPRSRLGMREIGTPDGADEQIFKRTRRFSSVDKR